MARLNLISEDWLQIHLRLLDESEGKPVKMDATPCYLQSSRRHDGIREANGLFSCSLRAKQGTEEYGHARYSGSSEEGKCTRKQDSKLSETNVGTRRDAEGWQTSVKMRTWSQSAGKCAATEQRKMPSRNL